MDSSHIYWANFGDGNGNGTTIGRANLDGTGVNEAFITGASGPAGVAVDGSHIYWGNYGAQPVLGTTIGRANLDGSGVNQSFISGADGPSFPATDGAYLYWTNFGAGGHGTTLGRANLDGTGANESFITGASGPHGVAIDVAAQDAPLTINCIAAGVTEDGNAVASAIFSDADPAGTPAQYRATINWGDGTPASNVTEPIVKNPYPGCGQFVAAGFHRYTAVQPHTVTITVTDVAGASISRSTTLIVSS